MEPIVIPPHTIQTSKSPSSAPLLKKRVAAYCRVSTDESSQLNSYQTQIDYYNNLISTNPAWEPAGVFADEGISGTATKKRVQFNRMIRLCRSRKIDLILCKSISRFARNTVDCLAYVRELKALDIPVIFEKENIDTGCADSEFFITLYAAFAQAESESISKNITWGIERSYREGRITYHLNSVLGYRTINGHPEIFESEAIHVRRIFGLFISGISMGQIANIMTDEGVIRRNGSSSWTRKNVEQILKNDNYCGRVTLQKTVTTCCITHKRAKNEGIKPKYIYENAHPAIITPEIFEKAQKEFQRRHLNRVIKHAQVFAASISSSTTAHTEEKGTLQISPSNKPTSRSVSISLGKLLICSFCGSHYRRVIWKSKDIRYAVYRCGARLEGGKTRCPESFTIKESILIDNLSDRIRPQLLSLTGEDINEISDIDVKKGILLNSGLIEPQYVVGKDMLGSR